MISLNELKKIDINKAVSIEGWMNENELLWLATEALTHELIVEVGSYHGRSTRALGDHTQGIVIAVDTWTGPIGANERDVLPSFYETFKTNLSDLIEIGIVLPVLPVESLKYIADSPDLVFIDADHTYEGVSKDIKFWLPKIKKGGMISGHDFFYPDVAQAVQELVPNFQLAPQTNIWFAIV
jgi:predicted O-methyltransferase YrrM